MSEINFTRKVFLEREELNRFQEFLADNIAQNTIVSNTRQFGIIQTNFVGSDTNFQVSQGTVPGTIQIEKEQSQALDADGRLIRLAATGNINVTNDSNWYWARISHVFRRYEVGTVSIDANGNMTGVGTLFNQVLRGQATDVAVQIRFMREDGTTLLNSGRYGVVNIVDNTNAVLTSTVGFQVESNLRYIVIGTTPIGEIVTTEQLQGLYLYDSCNFELVQETVANTPPALTPEQVGRFFYVARVMNASNTVTIQDQRDIDDTYWKFDVPGIQGAIIRRALPAPSAVDQYMLIGSIASTNTNYARLFWQGCEPNGGVVIDLRIANTLIGSTNTPSIIDNVLMGGGATFRPRFLYYVNLTTSRIELYAKSAATFPGGQWMPGYIAFVGENAAAGITGWTFAQNFTWTDTVPPTPNVTSTTAFAAYGTTEVINNVNELIDDTNTRITNANAEINSLDSRIDAINNTLTVSEVFISGAFGDDITDRGIYVRQYGLVVVATGFFDHDGTDAVTPIFRITAAEGIGLVTGLTTLDIYGYANDLNDNGVTLQLTRGVDAGTEFNQLETLMGDNIDARRHYFNMSWIIR